MRAELERFVREAADRNTSSNDEIWAFSLTEDDVEYLRDLGIEPPEVEWAEYNETGMVVCRLPDGTIDREYVHGEQTHVDIHTPMVRCARKGGEPLLAVHTHPGGIAAPSQGDVYAMQDEFSLGILPDWWCVGRKGDKWVFTCIDLREAKQSREMFDEAVGTLEYCSVENVSLSLPLAEPKDFVSVALHLDEVFPYFTDKAAKQVEEAWRECIDKSPVKYHVYEF